MITAEEFIEKSGYDWGYKEVKLKEMMIEFTKMHVIEALKQASEKVIFDIVPILLYDETFIVNKTSILKAYPLENIK